MSIEQLRLDLLNLQCKNYLSTEQRPLSFNIYPNQFFTSFAGCKDRVFQRAFPAGYGLLGTTRNGSRVYFWCNNQLKGTVKHSLEQRSLSQSKHSVQYANYHSLNIAQTSGTVSCAVVTRNGGVFIGSIAENHTDYNRIGELIYCKDQQLKYLKGHFITSSQSNESLRQTVSDMKYCSREDLVFTVGYDGALRVWDEHKLPNPICSYETLKSTKEQIQPLMDKHESKNLLTFTTTENSVYLFSYEQGEEFHGKLQRIMRRRKRDTHSNDVEKCSSITGMIDNVQFTRQSDSSSVSFMALTGNSESPIPSAINSLSSKPDTCAPGGVLEAFRLSNGHDSAKPTRTFSFAVGGVGFSCLGIQTNAVSNPLVAVGTGATGDGDGLQGDGHLYLLNERARNSLVAKLWTNHQECELVSFSPCGLFFVTCNATDNEALVYDVRYPLESLHSLKHGGDPGIPIENVMSAHWSSTRPGTLWTGGADRMVRVWDIGRGTEDCCIGQFQHLHPVNVLGFGDDTDERFVVGTLNDATVYSQFPVGESLDREIFPTIEYCN